MKEQGPNPAASVRQRLLNLSRSQGTPLEELMTRFTISRLLYRLTLAGFQEEFVLKGATLFTIWQEAPHRATRDVDLLGRGAPSIERLVEIFRKVATTEPDEPDGLVFDPDSVNGARIREDAEYEGVRIMLRANLTNARLRVQIDVGFGDIVSPGPEAVEVPVLLGFRPARLQAYPKETVIAEKCQAMILLGEANTRMKDFYDVWALASRHAFEGQCLSTALAATFARRRTPLPSEVPRAFTSEFTENPLKQRQWVAFLERAGIPGPWPSLSEVAGLLAHFLMPPLRAANTGEAFEQNWQAGGNWQPGI